MSEGQRKLHVNKLHELTTQNYLSVLKLFRHEHDRKLFETLQSPLVKKKKTLFLHLAYHKCESELITCNHDLLQKPMSSIFCWTGMQSRCFFFTDSLCMLLPVCIANLEYNIYFHWKKSQEHPDHRNKETRSIGYNVVRNLEWFKAE